MITKEGGCIDAQHGTVWVKLEYDWKRNKAVAVIWDKPGGRRLAINGVSGPGVKKFYDRLNIYFFGHDE